MPAPATLPPSKLKYNAPSPTQSFLRLSGTFEYLLTGADSAAGCPTSSSTARRPPRRT